MRRFRLTVFLLWACAALGCQGAGGMLGPGSGAASPQLDRILESGVLRVGLSGSQPPLNMRNKAGELIGLETEERIVLDKPLFIPLDRQAWLDCVMLKVTHEEVHWEGYIKHTDVRWETAAIPLSILEEVAGV